MENAREKLLRRTLNIRLSLIDLTTHILELTFNFKNLIYSYFYKINIREILESEDITMHDGKQKDFKQCLKM